jgi:hypothetical protein
MIESDGQLTVFHSDSYGAMGAFLAEQVPPADRDRLVFEPSAADELPGRRILLDDAPLCRVVPDPSDPRPLPSVVRRWIDAAGTPAVAH